jgi:putative glutamine amidotransferase
LRPLIGITAWRRELDTFYGADRLQTLSTHYVDAVTGAGMVPVVFPAGLAPESAERLVSIVDGVVLSGGDDVDPASYDAGVTASKSFDPEVDGFEIAVVEAARAQGKPLLAICRGLQLLNVALGGTLHQEVTEPGGAHEPFDRGTPAEWGERRHVVRFAEGSMIAALYGADEAKVNSLHHQGVDEVAPDLVAEGWADDGLVEAVRHAGDWWALGVQWHPERMDAEHRTVFAALRSAVTGS